MFSILAEIGDEFFINDIKRLNVIIVLYFRFNNVLSVVQGAGENDKLTQGLFENYLDCKFKDPYMDGVSLFSHLSCLIIVLIFM